MVDLKTIIDKLNELADPDKAEDYDNVGLIVGDINSNINNILICLDVEINTIKFAVENNINLIISHHPLIFNPIKHINADDIYFEIIKLALKNDINIFSLHTNFDKCPISNSDFIINALKPDNTFKTEDSFGCVGVFNKPIKMDLFIENIKKIIKDDKMRFYLNNDSVNKVCCIAGAGGRDENFFLQYGNSYDIIITSEIKHSITLISKIKKFSLCECSHRQSEIFFNKIIYEYLKNSGILKATKAIIYDKE